VLGIVLLLTCLFLIALLVEWLAIREPAERPFDWAGEDS